MINFPGIDAIFLEQLFTVCYVFLIQDKAQVLSDVRAIIADQLGADLDNVSVHCIITIGRNMFIFALVPIFWFIKCRSRAFHSNFP